LALDVVTYSVGSIGNSSMGTGSVSITRLTRARMSSVGENRETNSIVTSTDSTEGFWWMTCHFDTTRGTPAFSATRDQILNPPQDIRHCPRAEDLLHHADLKPRALCLKLPHTIFVPSFPGRSKFILDADHDGHPCVGPPESKGDGSGVESANLAHLGWILSGGSQRKTGQTQTTDRHEGDHGCCH